MSEYFPNGDRTRMRKDDLLKELKKQDKVIAAYREGYYENPPQWFAVAFIGWGSWEEDVFFTEADTPKEAIELFEKEIEKGFFDGHGSNRIEDRVLFGGKEQILLYAINEIGTYERSPSWELVKKYVPRA